MDDSPAHIADALFERLFPICRSITGNGVRETFDILNEVADFTIHEVPSGTRAYDWVVPDEWNVRDAYIADLDGNRLVDFRHNNLHLAGYSVAVDTEMGFDELDSHLQSLPNQPDAVPYRTLYYKRDWMFCLSQNQRDALPRDGRFKVRIDADHDPGGSLTYGDAFIEGESGREFLISSYCCHPSLANDNLSGPITAALLWRRLNERKTRHSYRFVIVPETIGAVVYLHRHEDAMKSIEGGFVLTGTAGPGRFNFKRSFGDNTLMDRAALNALHQAGLVFSDHPFDPHGSDERQYSSPGFRIPMVTIAKDKYYEYEEYHTSLDNLDFVSGENLEQTLNLYLAAIDYLERHAPIRALYPHGEVMLGKRNLYLSTGGSLFTGNDLSAGQQLDIILWTLFLADGRHDTQDIAQKTGVALSDVEAVVERLSEEGLIER